MTAAAKRKPKTKPVAKAAPVKPKAKTNVKPRERSMTTPDKDDKAAAAAEKRDHDKAAAEKRDHDKAAGHIDNRDQDPNHPANKTLSPERRAMPRSEAEAFNIPPDELLTEQEKDAVGAAGDATAGVGPVDPAEHTSGPVETVEDQGIGPRTPYPTGSPPPPDEGVTRSQGVKGVSDKPHNEPNKPLQKETHK
jgi:hypothetical protein